VIERSLGYQVRCMLYGESFSQLLMGDPCPSEPGASTYDMIYASHYSTLSIGLGIE